MGSSAGEKIKPFEYLEPETIEEAVKLLGGQGRRAKPVAGGNDLLVLMKQGLLAPERLVNLKRIPGLDYIRPDNGGLRIGALTSLNTIETSPLVSGPFGVLAQAVSKIACLQLRNTGTIGGNLCQSYRCWFYNQSHDWRRGWTPCYKLGGQECYADHDAGTCQMLYQSDAAPALMALDASIKAVDAAGARTIPVKDFLKKAGHALRSGEVIAEIEIPPQPPGCAGAYIKFSSRKAIDYPVAGVAVVLGRDAEGICRHARIAVGAVAPLPVRVEDAEKALLGKKIGQDELGQAAAVVTQKLSGQAISRDDHAADYKSGIVGVLFKRAVEACLHDLQNNA